MNKTVLTAKEFQAMIIAGGNNLNVNLELIDSLNVFPVPDGDTGTNMSMSFNSGVDNLKKSASDHVGELGNALAKGLLMGARGNSGVILSQIFRGFSKAIINCQTINSNDFIKAFAGAVESAYQAVMKPVEGTILTVCRESAIAGEKRAKQTDNIIEIMEAIVEGAHQSLERTPELLPVLKQVGVVDSGGKGLLCIYEGFLSGLTGEEIMEESHDEETVSGENQLKHAIFSETNEHPLSMDEITFGYCTEIMVRIGQGPTVQHEFDQAKVRDILNQKGDSLLVVADEEILKVHVHTENPGEIMQIGQEYGELIKIKVDNMREQVRELEHSNTQTSRIKNEAPTKDIAIIAVAAGQGLTELLESLGVDLVISGGQTMNPSTEDFVKAIEKVNASQYILLPNNKNIIMAAEQVADLVEVPVSVIPTRSIPQAISCLLAYHPDASLEENQANMTQMKDNVRTGQITYSIRDTNIDDVEIKKDDYMGIVDGDIEVANSDLKVTLLSTLRFMLAEESEIVTIFIGESGSEELVHQVIEEISADYSEVDFEVIDGQQPVYEYILSVE